MHACRFTRGGKVIPGEQQTFLPICYYCANYSPDLHLPSSHYRLHAEFTSLSHLRVNCKTWSPLRLDVRAVVRLKGRQTSQ